MGRYDVVIVGAGLAGLSTAYTLLKHNKNIRVAVIERDNVVGGLSKTIRLGKGFYGDTGPHRFHTKIPEVLNYVKDLVPLQDKIRISHIYMNGKMFKYPLEGVNVAALMPPHITAEIFFDYLKALVSKARSSDRNFEEWVVSRFGRKIFDIYFGPYTEKVWGIPCSEISADWADQRIKLLNLKEAIIGMLNKRSTAREKIVSRFYYPQTGGIGSISHALTEMIEHMGGKLILNAKVNAITTIGKRLEVAFTQNSKPRNISTRYVVSTMPLSHLPQVVDSHNNEIDSAASNLRFRALLFVYLLIKKDHITNDHWIYFPQKDALFNRISESKNFCEALVPRGKTVICAEITCNLGDDIWNLEPRILCKEVVERLESIGLIQKDLVIGTYVHREREAYPLYKINYKRYLNKIMDFVMDLEGILPLGRGGLFRYNNMDHSIMMGIIAARMLKDPIARGESINNVKRNIIKASLALIQRSYLG